MDPSRNEQLRDAYREAASDPEYQAEMAEIDRAFDCTLLDGLDEEPHRTPPADHEEFAAYRSFGLKGVREQLARRRKQRP